MKNRKVLRMWGMALLVLFVSAFGAFGGEKVIQIAGFEPGTCDVQKTTSEYFVPINCFDRLVECVTGENGYPELVPGLAESWEVSEDGLVYTFHLRKGVKFHNGEELKADDVIYTFDRMLDPETKALNTNNFDHVLGAQARMDGETPTTEGFKALDDYTVQITLREPFAPFLARLSDYASSVYNRKFTEEVGQDFGLSAETVCGTGAFKLAEYVLNDHLVLEAFDDYYQGRSKLDKVIAKIIPDAETMRMMFETGEIDIFDCDQAISQLPYFLGNPKWKDHIHKGLRVGIYYVHLNQLKEPFTDVRVRKAFQMAVDRQKILESMFHGDGVLANGLMPKGLIGYNPDIQKIEYNPEKAKALLAEAGYPDGVDMALVQVSGWSNKWVRMNEIIQAMVKKAGFNVEIKQMDEASYYSIRNKGDMDPYTQSWSFGVNDPDSIFYMFFADNDGGRHRSWNNQNKQSIEDIKRARTIINPEERLALYRAIENTLVHEDAAILPLFSVDHLYVVNPRVKGFQVPWTGWSDMSYFGMDVEE